MSCRSLAAMNAPTCPANAKKCAYGAWELDPHPDSTDGWTFRRISGVLVCCGYGCGVCPDTF